MVTPIPKYPRIPRDAVRRSSCLLPFGFGIIKQCEALPPLCHDHVITSTGGGENHLWGIFVIISGQLELLGVKCRSHPVRAHIATSPFYLTRHLSRGKLFIPIFQDIFLRHHSDCAVQGCAPTPSPTPCLLSFYIGLMTDYWCARGTVYRSSPGPPFPTWLGDRRCLRQSPPRCRPSPCSNFKALPRL